MKSPESRVNLHDFDPKVGMTRGASKLKEICWYLVKMVFFLSAFPFPSAWKAVLLRLFGAKVNRYLVIKPRVNIHFPWKLSIGEAVWLGEEVCILNFEPISIGNNVCISQRAFICGGNHNYKISTMEYKNGPVILKDGCWIGAGCFIGPGITIGVDTVVCAGAVVSQSLDDNGIYKGNPVVFVKERWNL
nr:WcaF family extracellular polysaccharide biosynthesis acetyltransferase [Pedobacter sp. ASV19]